VQLVLRLQLPSWWFAALQLVARAPEIFQTASTILHFSLVEFLESVWRTPGLTGEGEFVREVDVPGFADFRTWPIPPEALVGGSGPGSSCTHVVEWSECPRRWPRCLSLAIDWRSGPSKRRWDCKRTWPVHEHGVWSALQSRVSQVSVYHQLQMGGVSWSLQLVLRRLRALVRDPFCNIGMLKILCKQTSFPR